MKLLKCLSSNKGFSTFVGIAAMLVILIISVSVYEYIRLITITSSCRNKFEDALVTISVANYAEIHSSVRESYASSYSYENGSWVNVNNVTRRNIEAEILSALNTGEEKQVKSISNIFFTVEQSQTQTSQFRVRGSCTITLPFVFLWNDSFDVTLNADTYWQAQF